MTLMLIRTSTSEGITIVDLEGRCGVECAETLHAANDGIANATAALSVFEQYDIDEHKHSSSDGQRIETQIPTINARHSSKYFALKKGVSAYTMVFNHVPCDARIIGTHEHESHFVYDILHNYTTHI